MLASFPDTLKDALFILRVRFVSRLRRKQCCRFIQFATGFNTQLIYPGCDPVAAPPSAIRPEAIATSATVPFGVRK